MTNDPWNKLMRYASTAPREAEEMPFGFTTRVVAQWRSSPIVNVWKTREIFAWRGALIAGAITLLCLALNYDAIETFWDEDTAMAGSFVELLATP